MIMNNNQKELKYVSLPLMEIGEAARFLGVGRQVVYDLIERREIRSVRYRGKTLVEKKSLESFRKSGRLT